MHAQSPFLNGAAAAAAYVTERVCAGRGQKSAPTFVVERVLRNAAQVGGKGAVIGVDAALGKERVMRSAALRPGSTTLIFRCAQRNRQGLTFWQPSAGGPTPNEFGANERKPTKVG